MSDEVVRLRGVRIRRGRTMLLRRGSVLAAGPLPEVFTEQNLSRCFGVPLIVESNQARWTARAVL